MTSGLDGIRVIPLTPALAAEWERFFAEDAFADDPGYACCWCRCFRMPGGAAEWAAACAADANRAPMRADVRAGRVHGVLALAGDRVIGWCHADARAEFHFKRPLQSAASPQAPDAAAIVCFLVAPPWRGRGVAAALLDGACAELARAGFLTVDAYPRRNPPTPAERFGGTREMLERAGFSTVAELPELWVMRRGLA
jgi:GNAT superfamily N-acetyltransferase